MPTSKPPYPAAFRQQMIELVESGRTPAQLARELRLRQKRGPSQDSCEQGNAIFYGQ